MKTTAIIAEYNPFHRGHAYQIEEIRKQCDADYIVVVMSGNFVQRGAPAWTDKYLRTQMALAGGASLVIELPTVYATASAEDFANGAVSLLHRLGFVDTLCFGSECGTIEPLAAVASFLSAPDKGYEALLREHLHAGMSYPAARNAALTKKFPALLQADPSLLSTPNNILGIEYLKALLRLNSPITPMTIARTDGGYHETQQQGGYLSASGIRKQFEKVCIPQDAGKTIPLSDYSHIKEAWKDCFHLLGDCVPEYVQELLLREPLRFPVTTNDLSAMLYYRLRTISEKESLPILDMTPDLFHRIRHCLPHYTSLSDFISRVKTRQYTYTRISRTLLHLLLNIHASYTDSPTLYGRLLGLRGDASRLLREVSEIPVITKAADADSILETFYPKNKAHLASLHWQTDCLADDLYRQTLYHKNGYLLPDIYHTPLIIM